MTLLILVVLLVAAAALIDFGVRRVREVMRPAAGAAGGNTDADMVLTLRDLLYCDRSLDEVAAQGVDVVLGGVDDEVGVRAYVSHRLALGAY